MSTFGEPESSSQIASKTIEPICTFTTRGQAISSPVLSEAAETQGKREVYLKSPSSLLEEPRTPDSQKTLPQLRILWEDPGGLYGGRDPLGEGHGKVGSFLPGRNEKKHHLR